MGLLYLCCLAVAFRWVLGCSYYGSFVVFVFCFAFDERLCFAYWLLMVLIYVLLLVLVALLVYSFVCYFVYLLLLLLLIDWVGLWCIGFGLVWVYAVCVVGFDCFGLILLVGGVYWCTWIVLVCYDALRGVLG